MTRGCGHGMKADATMHVVRGTAASCYDLAASLTPLSHAEIWIKSLSTQANVLR